MWNFQVQKMNIEKQEVKNNRNIKMKMKPPQPGFQHVVEYK